MMSSGGPVIGSRTSSLTVRVGDCEVTSISDKAHTFDPAWHFPSVAPSAWHPHVDLIGGAEGYTLINFGGFLVRHPDHVVLIDTGWGPELGPPGAPHSRGALLDELTAIGVRPEDVDIVAFTHLHADHVGWNLVSEGDEVRARFPRARYQVSAIDWAHFSRRPDLHENIRAQALPLAGLGVLETFDDGHQVTPFITAEATPGHTPGHTSFLVSSAGETVFILGDLVHHPVIAAETDWVHRFDVSPETAVATRRRILERLEREGTLVGAGHLQHPSLGRFIRSGRRRRWQPIALPRPG